MKYLIAIILLSFGTVSAVVNMITELSIETDMVDVSMHPGESRYYSIWVSNILKQNLSATISVIGKGSSFMELYLGNSTVPLRDSFLIQSEATEHISTRVYSWPTSAPGTYSGYIVVNTKNRTYGVPVVVKLTPEREAQMDVKVEPLANEIMLGEPVKFYVSVYNLGSNEKTGIHFIYTVKDPTLDKVVAQYEENATIETSLFFVKTFQPEEVKMEMGKYTFETKVLYDSKSVSASCSFEAKDLFATYARRILVGLAILIVLATAAYIIKQRYGSRKPKWR